MSNARHSIFLFLLICSAKKKKKSSKKSSGFDKDVIIGTAMIKVTVSLMLFYVYRIKPLLKETVNK